MADCFPQHLQYMAEGLALLLGRDEQRSWSSDKGQARVSRSTVFSGHYSPRGGLGWREGPQHLSPRG